MWPYWLLFIIIALISLAHAKPQKPGAAGLNEKLAWSFFFAFLALLIGFRHEVGGDWQAYEYHVENMRGEAFGAVWQGGDPLYALLNWIGANIGGGVYFVNVVSACLFCWGLIAFCRIQPRPWLALLVASPYLITVVAMGYTRQGVAIGLSMLAISSLEKGKFARFVFWVAMATLFHKSALVLLPFALFVGQKTKIRTIIGVMISAAVLFVLFLQEHLDGLIQNYIEAQYESSGAKVRIAMNALPAGIFLLFYKRFDFDAGVKRFWFWLAWSALAFVPVLILIPSSTAIDRIALYWIPLQLVIWSRLPEAFGVMRSGNPVFVFFVIFFCAAVLFVWLHFADNSYAWVPYQFYPLTL